MIRNHLSSLLSICGLLLLSACASTERVPVPVDDRSSTVPESEVEIITESDSIVIESEQPEPVATAEERQGTIEAAPVEETVEQSDQVVLAFLNEAEQQAANGNTDQAIASLERGVRIKPKDPWLWHQLAVLRLQKQQWQEAIAMAEKSLALSGHNRGLLAGNWQVIATAKRSIGDEAGARAAEEKASQYQPSLTS